MLDGSIKNDEAIVGTSPQQEGSDSLISFTFPPTLIVGAVYKVNVYSVVDAANQVKFLTMSRFKIVQEGLHHGFESSETKQK